MSTNGHSRRSSRLPLIADRTGPVDLFVNRRVLLLADIENLCYSAQRHLHRSIRFGALGRLIRASACRCDLHAFFSSTPDDKRFQQYLEQHGWVVHQRAIETVETYQGQQRLANIDSLLTFQAGVLVSRTRAEVIILASGDGTLVCDLAKAIANLPSPRHIMTLSLAGSTSQRLNAAHNPIIQANLEIGHDCLRPIMQVVR